MGVSYSKSFSLNFVSNVMLPLPDFRITKVPMSCVCQSMSRNESTRHAVPVRLEHAVPVRPLLAA